MCKSEPFSLTLQCSMFWSINFSELFRFSSPLVCHWFLSSWRWSSMGQVVVDDDTHDHDHDDHHDDSCFGQCGFWKEGEKIKIRTSVECGPWEGPRLENLFVIKFPQKEEILNGMVQAYFVLENLISHWRRIIITLILSCLIKFAVRLWYLKILTAICCKL